MNRPILIQGGRVIDPSRGADGRADVLLMDGRVEAVEIVSALGGSARRFETDGRDPSRFFGAVCESGGLVRVGARYELHEADGSVTRFSADGRLDYVLGGYYEKASPMSPFQGSYSPITFVNTAPAPAGVPLPPRTLLPFMSTLSCTDVANLQFQPINTFGSPQVPGLLQN